MFLHFLVSFKSKLGDIVYVQLPDVGETVTEGGTKPICLETVYYLTEPGDFKVTSTCWLCRLVHNLYVRTFKLHSA